MTTVGIISEYNPFHNGHRHHIRCVRERYPEAQIISVMGGSFTQRGECAILSKWQRAESAVRNGVDLVVELPASYTVRSAQDFARGGVQLLNAMGVVDLLSFGTKYADADAIMKAADYADTQEAQQLLHQEIQKGLSYGAALRKVMEYAPELQDIPYILQDPNSVLALEYVRSLKSTGSAMKPLPILRIGADHHSMEIGTEIASGTAIRTAIQQLSADNKTICNTVPEITYADLIASDIPYMENLFHPLLNRICFSPHEELSEIYGVNEGLENRIVNAAYRAKSLGEFIQLVSTKRYSHSRIRRLVFYILRDIKKEYMQKIDNARPQYIRVLAFNQTGRSILRDLKSATSLPVITKFSDYFTDDDVRHTGELSDLKRQLILDVYSTDLQGMCMKKPILGRDFTTSPIFVR